MNARIQNIINVVKSNPIYAGLVGMLLLASLVLVIVSSGTKKEVKKKPVKMINVVTEISPVRAVTPAQNQLLDRLRGLPAAEQDRILREEWPTLATDLVGWLRRDGRIKGDEKIEKVTLFYGSGAARSEDAAGTIHEGRFENELLAEIVITGRKDPMLVAVRCTNGMYDVVRGDLYPVGERQLVFTIGQGESLVNYVSYETAIHLAVTFSLPIHKDRGSRLRQIDAAEALRTDTDRHQVRVLVYPGDTFNLGAMTYAPAQH